MAQVQAYQGYFKNGQFISSQIVKLPENVEVFITVTDRAMPQDVISKEAQKKILTNEQQAAFEFLKSIEKVNKKDFDEETLESFKKWDDGEFRLKFEEKAL